MTSFNTGQVKKDKEGGGGGGGCVALPPSGEENYPPLPRALKFVGYDEFLRQKSEMEAEADRTSVSRLLTQLSRTSLIVASVLFLCQVGAAICLCRPVAVLGGILVSTLFLCQGVLGTYVIKTFSQTLLVGFSCLSGFVFVTGLGAALFLLAGQFTVACVSSFHTFTDQSATRLRVVESISLLGSIPCLMGAVACFLAAVIAARTSKRPRTTCPEPQVFLYLNPSSGSEDRDSRREKPNLTQRSCYSTFPSAPSTTTSTPQDRSSSPPPSYNQFNEESYA